jgi:hypothetical protein
MNDKFCFIHESEEVNISVEVKETDYQLQSWPYVLDRFVKFLESVYRYEIQSKIKLQYSRCTDPETDWYGKFFDVPEDDEDEPYDEYDQKENAGLTE